MPRRGDSVRKRKDGRWEGRYITHYTEEGKAKYKSVYGHTYSETKEKLLLAQGTAPLSHHTSLTMEELTLLWIETKKGEIKPSTCDKYESIIYRHILPKFSHVPVAIITSDNIEDYYRSISNDVSVSLLKTIHSVIVAIFEYAKRKQLILNSIGRIKIPQTHETKGRAISTSDRMKLEQYLLINPDICKVGIYLCLYTGMRIGELCALKWSEIDLNNRVIMIRFTVQRVKNRSESPDSKTKLMVSSPKTFSSSRDIPIPDQLCDLLRRYQSKNDCFVLTNCPDKPMEPRCLQYKFKKILVDADISDTNFHSLRHSFASECIAAGVDAKSLSEILGHTNVEITLNRYMHSSEERKRNQIAKLFNENGQT